MDGYLFFTLGCNPASIIFFSANFSNFGFWGSFRLTSVSFGHMLWSFISCASTTRYSSVMLYFPCPSSGNQSYFHFSSYLILFFFFLTVIFKNQELTQINFSELYISFYFKMTCIGFLFS